MEPLISVIVPVYNVEKYLVKCIDTIINQTYKNLEILLIDDGSTDNSLKICMSYAEKDSRIRVLKKENGGQGSARNVGLDICKGEYISFIDSDDWIEIDMMESMYEAINKNNAQLSVCGLLSYNGLKFSGTNYFPQGKLLDNHELMKEYVSKYISNSTINTGPCNKLYHRSLFDTIRFPNKRAKEDAYIMHQLLGKVTLAIHIGECKYIYRIRSDSTERSAFTPDKLTAKECNKLLQIYIYNNYPDLYDYVKYNYAFSLIRLMKEIISSFRYYKYKQEFILLKDELLIERKYIKDNSESKIDNEIRQINWVCDYPMLFKVKCTIEGIKRKLKKEIKKIILFSKNKYYNLFKFKGVSK